MFPRQDYGKACSASSLCVSRDVSIRNGQVKRPFLFALREQGCFSGRTKRTEKMLVRSA